LTFNDEVARAALVEAAAALRVDGGMVPYEAVRSYAGKLVENESGVVEGDRGAVTSAVMIRADMLFRGAAGVYARSPYGGWGIPRDLGPREASTVEVLVEAAGWRFPG
jgi:hypothetical protein